MSLHFSHISEKKHIAYFFPHKLALSTAILIIFNILSV